MLISTIQIFQPFS